MRDINNVKCPACKWCREKAKIYGSKTLYRCANCKHMYEIQEVKDDTIRNQS